MLVALGTMTPEQVEKIAVRAPGYRHGSQLGVERFLVSMFNAREAAVVEGIEVFGFVGRSRGRCDRVTDATALPAST